MDMMTIAYTILIAAGIISLFLVGTVGFAIAGQPERAVICIWAALITLFAACLVCGASYALTNLQDAVSSALTIK